MIPRWFLYVGGFSMVILGALQIATRPRDRDAHAALRFLNLGTLWSLICISVGSGLLAMALGYWDGPLGANTPPPQPSKHRRR